MNIVSSSGPIGKAGHNCSATKTVRIGARHALVRKNTRRNVLINAVAHHLMATEMTEHLSLDSLAKATPLGRVGKTEKLTGCLPFVLKASLITGQTLAVKGHWGN